MFVLWFLTIENNTLKELESALPFLNLDMSSISSLVLSQARSAVDEAIYIVQGQIKAQSEHLAKQIEASSGMRRQFGAPPTTKSVVGDMNPTTVICQPLGLPLGNEHPGTILRRSERLASRRCDHGTTADKMVRTKWYNFIFCEHLKFVEFNIYLVTKSHK